MKVGSLASAFLIAFLILSGFVSRAYPDVLVDTEADFSLAAQGINGLQYGYYDTATATGTFTTAGMFADTRWEGPGGDETPIFTPTISHPLVNPSATVTNSSVRRFTFGPDYSGLVAVTFQIWKVPFGSIGNGADAFVTFDNQNLFYARIPNGSTQEDPYIDQTLFFTAIPGDTVDFGLTDDTGNGVSDVVGFTAQISTAPEPASLAVLTIGAIGMLARRRKTC